MKVSKKVKNIMLTSLFFGITSVAAISTVVPTYFSIRNNVDSKLFSFDGQTYNNFEDLFNNISSKYFKSSNTFNQRYKWSIDNGNGDNALFFNDPMLLRKEMMKNIKTYKGYSSFDIKNNSNYIGANNELTTEALLKIYFDNFDNLKQTIYRGKNNSIHLSEEDAKRSYLSIHDAYHFNNLYFSNKEQLELYLNNVYFANGNTENVQKMISVINTSNNLQSSAINQNDLFENLNSIEESKRKDIIDAKKSFANFVNLGVNKYLQIENKINDNSSNYSYYKKEDIYSTAQLVEEFDNPDYTRLYENNGKNTYVVDLDKEDEANLFGPYILSSQKDIEMMKDKKQWKNVKSENRIITKQRDVYLLSSIFETFLLSDDSIINLPINIRALNDSILIPYFDKLKAKYSNIHSNFVNLLNNLRKGKNFNKFYELILSYVWLINNLISNCASEDIIKDTKNTFNAIVKYMDEIIYLIFPKNLLIGKSRSKISFTKIFEFKDNNKNLNTDINYYVDTISENYPQFIVALSIMSLGIINSTFNASAIDFKYDKFGDLVAKSCSYENEKMESKYYDDYKFIYELFSITSIDYFYNLLKNNSQYMNSNLNNKDVIVKEISAFNFSNLDFSTNPVKVDYFLTKEKFYNTSSSSHNYVVDKSSAFYNIKISIANKIIDINNKTSLDENKISFQNFLLIKMLSKFNLNEFKIMNLLQKYENNSLSQNELNINLNKMIDNLSSEDFAKNFQIIDNSTDILFNIRNKSEYIDSTRKNTEIAKNIFKGIDFIANNYKNRVDVVKSFLDISKKSTDFIKLASRALSAISGVLGYVNIAMSTVSLIIDAFVPNKEFISYIYENEAGQKYIWDGGSRTTMFWGLCEISSVGIEKMKLIGPEKILEANNKEQYYFNGKKYDTLDLLKKEQLRQILNGSYNAESIRNVYSWENIKGETSFKPEGVFDEVNLGDLNSISNIDFQIAITSSFIPQDVTQYVYKKIAQDIDNKKENSKYFNSSFKYAGGFPNSDSVTGDIKELITDILDNIKTVKIVQLPNIDNDKKPISIDKPGDDGSISEFVLPSKSWNFMTTTYNDTNNKYIIYDPNVDDKSNENVIDSLDVKKLIEKQFFEQFDVEHKNTIKHDVQTINLYSELSQNINTYQIYSATLLNGETKTFLELDKAFDWLLTKMNFTMYQYQITENTYEYNGIVFNSKQEFRNYILNNMEVKNA